MNYYERIVRQERLPIGMKPQTDENGKAKPLAFWRAVLELAAVMYFNIRLDYLRVDGYFRQHWKHWLGWTLFAVGAQAYLVFFPQGMRHLEPFKYVAFGFAWVYYYIGNWMLLGPLKRVLLPRDPALAVRVYEVVVVSMWLGIQIALQVLCISTRGSPEFAAIPVWATTAAGTSMIAVGYGFKGWATWLVGIDSYFFRDLQLEIPNERLVQSNLYRFLHHPTYTVGYLQGYGFAVLTRSLEGFFAAAALHLGIFLFFMVCEGPGMRRLYGGALEIS